MLKTNSKYAKRIFSDRGRFAFDSACGEGWTACFLTSESEEMVEILIHNPHSFGNETAIDEMLSSVAFGRELNLKRMF